MENFSFYFTVEGIGCMVYTRIYVITLLMAVLYAFLVSSMQLMDGGLIGLALIIHYLLDYQTGYIYLGLNIPILMWVYRVDKTLFKRSIFGMVSFSINMTLMELIPNPFILSFYPALVMAGILLGLCFYLMSKLNASFGGISPIGVKLNEWGILKLSYFYWITDVAVLLLGLYFFGWASFLYSCLFVTVQAASVELFSRLTPLAKKFMVDVFYIQTVTEQN